MKAYAVKTTSVLQQISYGGSNSGNDAPKVAEGKGNYDDDDWD